MSIPPDGKVDHRDLGGILADDMDQTTMPDCPRVGFITFGCRVNQYETEMMRTRLEGDYCISNDAADVYIVNGCTVTALADKKARQAVHRLRRERPDAKIVLIGCLGAAVKAGLSQIDGVDLIAGNDWKPRIREVVARVRAGETGVLPEVPLSPLSDERISDHPGRVRAFLKVQDGCDLACTYCRTTQVRGPSRSKPIPAAIAEARTLVARGYPEIVLTGINLAQYNPPNGNLARLVGELLQIKNLRRLRLASINPYGITEELVQTFAADPRACPHFHIPLQSGDDRILRAMHRGYTADFYRSRIGLIRKFLPDATVGADVIVGFPGEDDTAFRNTCALITEIGFANLHIFRYSPRRGTVAAQLPEQVSAPVKRARAAQLEEIYRTIQNRVLAGFMGKNEQVLIEQKKDGVWRGYTRGYIDTYVVGDMAVGDQVQVRITAVRPGYLEGVTSD